MPTPGGPYSAYFRNRRPEDTACALRYLILRVTVAKIPVLRPLPDIAQGGRSEVADCLSIHHLAWHNVTIRKDMHSLKRILLARKSAALVAEIRWARHT